MTKLHGGPFTPAPTAPRLVATSARPASGGVLVDPAPVAADGLAGPASTDGEQSANADDDGAEAFSRAWRRRAIRRGDRLEVPVVPGRTVAVAGHTVERYRRVHEGRVVSLRTAARSQP